MGFKAVPIDVISAPNVFSELQDGAWIITSPNAQTLWFRLDTIDSLGQRPYIAGVGGAFTLNVIFQRADTFTINSSNLNQLDSSANTITKPATANVNNGSLFSFQLTSTDVAGILSGTVKFTLAEVVTTTWVQNWALSVKLTDPGF